MRAKSAYSLVIALVALFVGCLVMLYLYDLPESSFDLASDSRLPRWIDMPPGSTRANLDVTLSYYLTPRPGTARYTLNQKDKKFAKTVQGENMCGVAFNLDGKEGGHSFEYPAYEAIRANGVTEIIEHKKMEPIFYVTDDPAVWSKYLSLDCK